MFLIESNNNFYREQILLLLKQDNFSVTNDPSSSNFCQIYVELHNKNLILKLENSELILNIPCSWGEIIKNIENLLKDYYIKVSDFNFNPYMQKIVYKEKALILGNLHNIIFKNLLLYLKSQNLSKNKLYSQLWPKDKSLNMNKLDTHITNLKNLVNVKLGLRLDITSDKNIIRLNIIN